jgi:osmotically-inducible protein OsmY
MRLSLILLALLLSTGCTALVVGGSSGGYQSGKDERGSTAISSDSAITTRIREKYKSDSVVSEFNIAVRAYKGTVYLSGTVNNYAARDRAVRLAKETGGVTAVNSQIVIEDQNK